MSTSLNSGEESAHSDSDSNQHEKSPRLSSRKPKPSFKKRSMQEFVTTNDAAHEDAHEDTNSDLTKQKKAGRPYGLKKKLKAMDLPLPRIEDPDVKRRSRCGQCSSCLRKFDCEKCPNCL